MEFVTYNLRFSGMLKFHVWKDSNFAAREIIKGRTLRHDDLICLRPSNNKTDPIKFWDLIVSKVLRNYSKLESINE